MNATYWNAEVSVDGRCVVSVGGSSPGSALTAAVREAIYYQASYPAARVLIGSIREACTRCHNDGKVHVRTSRSTRIAKCPVCKGKGAHGTIDDVAFTMPDSANQIKLTAGYLEPAAVA